MHYVYFNFQLCVLSDSESKTNHRNFTDAEQESGQNAQTDWNGKTNSRIPGLDIAESPVNDTDFRCVISIDIPISKQSVPGLQLSDIQEGMEITAEQYSSIATCY